MKSKSDESQLSVPYDEGGREGFMPVPGAVLNYRIAGPGSAQDVVVFENGWSGSYPYAAWLEQALAPHVRVVCYDRAGVGDSKSTEPITPARITDQLLALLDGLGISKPVVVVGHSYGGLIAALHTGQAPGRIRAVVQADGTPEFEYAQDGAISHIPKAAIFMKLLVRMGMGGVITSAYHELPPDAFQRITKSREWMIKAIDGSVPEIRLFHEIRRLIQASEVGKRCPRLVISAKPPITKHNALTRLLMSPEKIEAGMNVIHGLHQRQAQHNRASHWMTLPYSHVSLISNRTAAEAVARHTLNFMREVN